MTAATDDPIRVIVVDDDSIVRSALVAYAQAAPDLQVVGSFANGAEAVAAVDADPVDVVIMDIRMPVLDGISAAERIRATHKHTRVLLLTSFDEDHYMVDALAAGASGFLLKDASPKALVDAVHAVVEGTTVVSPEPLGRLVRSRAGKRTTAPSRPPQVELSARELEILRLLCQALSNSEIADRLFLSESTVKTHVSAIMTKLAVPSRLKAVVRAFEWGLVERTD
nr:response regulator transcription factor [Propionibacterium sp.]